ncbi:hypothetical protein INT45_005871 [Circinella minor]|uniref:Uncharacterized protein n=1 Tax=Circinella minor TaxID=1195481 RepID=A0A8H7S0S0_9FUNG|nr:hypothetical protein INT45_005871 [Circinella minor]
MGDSFSEKYRLAIVHYKRFVQERRPERLGKDQPPLFPMSQDDLLRYYDHKFEICTYRATRNYISLLIHHPQHGPEWKRDVYDSYPVEEKKHLMREAERKGERYIISTTVSKNQLLSTTPSLSRSTQQTPKVNTSGYRLLGQEQLNISGYRLLGQEELKRDEIVSFSNKRQRFQEQKKEKRLISNEMNTIKLNVNQLAKFVRID